MSQARKLWIGVDGGGTKTALTLIAAGDEPLGKAVVESTNPNSVGPEKAKQTLIQGIKEVLANGNASASEVAGICLGMAGVDRPSDKERVKAWVNEALPAGVPTMISNDAVVALASGTRGKLFGVVVIAGTGTISVGFDAQGESKRAAGWGPLLGDDGSGYAIASEVLRAVVQAADGRGPPTMLQQEVLSNLHLEKAEDLIGWTYKDTEWARLAALAPLAFECEKKGDAVASKIVHAAAGHLAHSITAVVKRLKLEEQAFPMVLAGGLLTHEGSRLAELLVAELRKAHPKCEILFPSVDPALAAALLARHSASKP